MRLIDVDELIKKLHETALKDGDDRSIMLNIIDKTPIKDEIEIEKMCEELKAHIECLRRQNDRMRGEIKALTFAVKCGGVSGNEVCYESD